MNGMTLDTVEAVARLPRGRRVRVTASRGRVWRTFRLVAGYWRRAGQRAFRDTCSLLRLTPRRVLIGWLTVVVVVSLGGVFAGPRHALITATGVLLAAGVCLVVFLGTFMLNLLAAPAKMEAERRKADRDGAQELPEPVQAHDGHVAAPEPRRAEPEDPDREDKLERLNQAIESGESFLSWFLEPADSQLCSLALSGFRGWDSGVRDYLRQHLPRELAAYPLPKESPGEGDRDALRGFIAERVEALQRIRERLLPPSGGPAPAS